MDQSKYIPFYMAYFGNIPAMKAEASTEEERGFGAAEPFMEEVLNQEWQNALMQSYYPEQIQMLQGLVEQVCDEEDYAGSRIYDEYPDRRMLRHMGEKIAKLAKEQQLDPYGAVAAEESVQPYPREDALQAQWYPEPPHHRPPHGRPPMGPPPGRRPKGSPLQDLAEILLYNEIRRRRCNRGRCNRRW